MKVRLLLSYKGCDFFGWQKQKNQRTVQEEVEKALHRLFKKQISLVGSGRTDVGVHALGQTAHFEIEEKLFKKIPLVKALNHLMPKDISLLSSWKAPDSFHARFSAKKKTYLYFIWTGESPPVLFSDRLWWRPREFSLEKLQKIADLIIGTKNFKSFQTAGSPVQNTIRSVYQSHWSQISPSLYCYTIQGSGFLKQMVRNLVGTYVDLLKEKKPEKTMKNILKSQDRKAALNTAPGKGLYLKKVFYSPALDKKCIKL